MGGGELSKRVHFPRGSKYPMFEASGSKNHTVNGFGDQGPYVLGTWPLWVRLPVLN